MSTYSEGIEKIANHMKISIAEAEDFFRQVQHCFRGYKVGEPKPKDPNDIYHVMSRFNKNLTAPEVYEIMAQNTKSDLNRERVPRNEVEKCSHGTPKTQPCNLCNEKDFRFMTGID